jgi:uncharacterized protein (TIGR02145 family)
MATFTSCCLIAQDKGSFTDSRDGHKYGWVKIGTQTWMSENLNFKAPDELMPAKSYGKNFSSTGCLDDKDQNCPTYGRYYDARTAAKVCPSGWHLPSDDEWVKMLETFGEAKVKTASDYSIRYGQSQGKLIKLGGSSGFNAKLAGFSRFNVSDMTRKSSSIGELGIFWSSTNSGDIQSAWAVNKDKDDVGKSQFDYEAMFYGLSVRCVKN